MQSDIASIGAVIDYEKVGKEDFISYTRFACSNKYLA